jgi:hypothetical protein
MRITKKFAGSNGIGKQIFSPTLETEKSLEVRYALQRDIEDLERRFFKRIDYNLASQPPNTIPSQVRNIPSVPSGTYTTSSGYRIVLPGDTNERVPLDYAQILSFHFSSKPMTTHHVIPMTESVPTPKTTLNHVASTKSVSNSQQQSGKSTKLEPGCYVNEAYRVHGFEPRKREPTKKRSSEEPARKKAPESLPTVAGVPKEKAYVNKKYHVAKTEFKPSKKNSAISAVDPSMDLHASALLLDFFRAARDKEVSDNESDDSSTKRDQVYIDPSYSLGGDEVDTQEYKKLKTV